MNFEKLNAALDLKEKQLNPEKITKEELEEYGKIYTLYEEDRLLAQKACDIGLSFPEQFLLKSEALGFGIHIFSTLLNKHVQLVLNLLYKGAYYEKVEAYSSGLVSSIVPFSTWDGRGGFPGVPICTKVEDKAKYKSFAESFKVFHKNFRVWLDEKLKDVCEPAEFAVLCKELDEKIGKEEKQPETKLRDIEDEFTEEIAPLIKEDRKLIKKCRQAKMTFPKSLLISGKIGLGISPGTDPRHNLKDLALYTYDNKVKVEVYLDCWPKTGLVWHSIPENYPSSVFMSDYGPFPAPKAMLYKQYVKEFKAFHKNFRNWLNSELLNKGVENE